MTEIRTQVRRWFVETGWSDGNGIGLWQGTKDSVPVSSQAEAEALRDEWLASGKLRRTQWGELRPDHDYGLFGIRSVWEDATPESLALSPEVAKLVAEAVARERERCALVIDAKPQPCSPVFPDSWTNDQIAHYESGQLDAAASFAAAIRSGE